MNDLNFRHNDHKFELSRQEFIDLINKLINNYGYSSTILPIGFIKANNSSISQMAILTPKKNTSSNNFQE